MSTFSQNLPSLFFTFLADAIIFGVIFFLIIYLFVAIALGPESISIDSRPIKNAAMFGLAHASIICLLLLFISPKSIFSSALLTSLATAIVMIPATFYLNLQNHPIDFSTASGKFMFNSIKDNIAFSLIISALLFIPSFLTGLLIGKLRSLFFQLQ